jgi:hypothetical protein
MDDPAWRYHQIATEHDARVYAPHERAVLLLEVAGVPVPDLRQDAMPS